LEPALFELNEPECCLKPATNEYSTFKNPMVRMEMLKKLSFHAGTGVRTYYGTADASGAIATACVRAMLQAGIKSSRRSTIAQQ
jgi:hypothetical protein